MNTKLSKLASAFIVIGAGVGMLVTAQSHAQQRAESNEQNQDHGKITGVEVKDLARLVNLSQTDPPVVIKGGSMHLVLDEAIFGKAKPPIGSAFTSGKLPGNTTVQGQKYGFSKQTLSAPWSIKFCNTRHYDQGMEFAVDPSGNVTVTKLSNIDKNDFADAGPIPWPNGLTQHDWEFYDTAGDNLYFPKYIVVHAAGKDTTYGCNAKPSADCEVLIGRPHP